jgi:Ca-activated chloride channel family protein
MQIRLLYSLLLILGITLSSNAQLQRDPNTPEAKTRILFLLDGSGSMLANWEGDLRIQVAKKVLSELVDSLSTVKNLELALRVYGHQYNRKYQNCTDTKLEVPFSTNNKQQLITKLEDVKPQGVTPLAYSLLQATKDFTKENNVRNVIIIITDGLESCNGDPCEISLQLQSKHIFLRPFVVGIDMPLKYENRFDCLGKFHNAKSSRQLKTFLSTIVKKSMMQSWVRVDLLDIKGKATESNVNMSFINHATGITEYDYVHQIKSDGTSDKVQIDPVPTYDLIIHTIPKVIKKNIEIEEEFTIIKVKTPQGSVKFTQGNMSEYKNLKTIVRKKGKSKTIHVLNENKTEKLLVGSYDIEILSLPRIKKTITVSQGQLTRIDIKSPGKISILDNPPGYGTIYQIKADNTSVLIYNLNTNSPRTSLAIQPGRYKIVFRAKTAKGSIHTTISEFKIYSGKTTTVRLIK